MLLLPPLNEHIGWLRDLKFATLASRSVVRAARYKAEC